MQMITILDTYLYSFLQKYVCIPMLKNVREGRDGKHIFFTLCSFIHAAVANYYEYFCSDINTYSMVENIF